MSFQSLARRDVRTSLGLVPVWSRPDAFGGERPAVLAISGLFGGPNDLEALPEILAALADVCVMRIPGAGAPVLSRPGLGAVSKAAGEVVDQLFPGRPVVVLGVSIGATAALGVRAAGLRRVVAVEPLLATGGIWPLPALVRALLARADGADGEDVRELLFHLLGRDGRRAEARDYRPLLAALSVPADVLLAAEPLGPERPLEALPSLVPAGDREALAATPQVRLHLVPGAGHHLQAQASRALADVLAEACRRASGPPPPDPAGLDEALVEAAPLEALRVLHWGPGEGAFAAAYLPRNPAAALTALGPEPDAAPPADAEPFDVLAVAAPPPPALFARLAAAVRPGGQLVARWPGAAPAALAAQGFTPRAEAEPGLVRARKAGGAPPRPVLHLRTIAFAGRLMDVRTRLPARALASDPELATSYAVTPADLIELPPDAPKMVVLQRPAAMGQDGWRRLMARCIARGWLVALEYDDHPLLVARALGRSDASAEMERFAWVHAVQTTTRPLAEAFGALNPEVRVFENAVFELGPPPAADRPRRVFYGAIGRGGFAVEVARALAPAIAAFPDVEFVVVGDRAVFEALPARAKRFHDYLTYEAYLARMAECCVSLSPVEDLPLLRMKSDAKFLDAARAGVVTIASPAVYAGVIRHGETGFLARRLEDWPALLAQVLGEPALARRVGEAAWGEVRARRMFRDQIAARREWCFDLWSRRAELDAAVMRRLPGLAEAVAAERAALADAREWG